MEKRAISAMPPQRGWWGGRGVPLGRRPESRSRLLIASAPMLAVTLLRNSNARGLTPRTYSHAPRAPSRFQLLALASRAGEQASAVGFTITSAVIFTFAVG